MTSSLLFAGERLAARRSVLSRAAFLCLGASAAPLWAQSAGQAAAPSAVATLSPVVVTAGRFEQEADVLNVGVSIITAQDLRRSGVRTVNEAIMKLLGVPGRVDFYGGGDYSLDLRGFGSTAGSNQAIIVDGIKINEGDLGGTRLAGLAIDSVERIEVLRGNSAVLYGEGATGGAIVITTKRGAGSVRKNQLNVYSALGNFNTLEGQSTATLVAGDFSFDAAVNMRSSDNHRDNFHSETEGASIAAQWAHEALRVGVHHAHDKLESGLPGSLTAAQYAQNPAQASTPTARAAIHNARYGLFSSLDLANWQLGLDVGWRDKSLNSEGSYSYGYHVDARTVALKARHTASFARWGNSVVMGVDRGEWARNVAGAYGSVAEQTSNALYVKDELRLPSATRITAGVRAEAIKKSSSAAPAVSIDDTLHAWELGLWQPILDKRLSAYGRVGRSFRLPNADEYTFTATGNGLLPQYSRDIEVGARWAADGTRADMRLFRSALTNEIAYDPTANGGFGANVNYLDPTRRQGVELEASQDMGRRVRVRVAAAQRDARFESGANQGRRIPLVARRTVALIGEFQPLDGHRVDTVVRGVSSSAVDDANTCAVPRHATLDLRYAYSQPGLELAVGMVNATDRQYYTQAYRCAGAQATAIYPEAGRGLTASLRVSF